MDIRSLLFDETGRVRSGWRFVIFSVGFLCVVVLVGSFAGAVLQAVDPSPGESGAGRLATALTALTGALLVGWLCGKYLEGLPFRALGAWFTKGWLRNLICGILFGAATLSLAVFIAFVFGGLRFEFNNIDGAALTHSLGASFLIFALGAAWEEALFRGYILQTFARSGLGVLAITLTAVFFGAIHAKNPNVDKLAVVNTMLAGVWFGVAYLKTRDLWFVWGIHLMWNWMQGAFFGIEVSGITSLVPAPLLREIDRGPAWLTGETYGVEGGVVTTIALIISTVVIYFLPYLKPSGDVNANLRAEAVATTGS
ncbi:MAG TPA: type II CAAX endopeptidase family protein [Pyrinomonadaceae bacterium]|nr:type II CAAX endopeptidase family protein [Pyrinomonadaceae bacterium]